MRGSLFVFAVVVMVWGLASARAERVGALTVERAVQVGTAIDESHPDQAALYALMADVMEWPTVVSDTGARVADVEGMLAEPASWRGALVVLEGRYAGRQRRIALQRAGGPWGDAVTEWGVTVAGAAGAQGERGIVIVWFADEAGAVSPPRHDAPVRVIGRFLNVWADVDASGAASRYPVIVARRADELSSSGAVGGGVNRSNGAGVVLVLLLVLVYAVWRLRKWGRVSHAERRVLHRDRLAQARLERGLATPAREEPDDDAVDLPSDPAAALDVLQSGAQRGA